MTPSLLGALAPRISREQASEVIAWCRENHVMYGSMSSYASVRPAARKHNITTTNGMLVHYPRAHITGRDGGRPNNKAYLVWRGEPLASLIESLAFIRMTTDRTCLMVLRDGRQ